MSKERPKSISDKDIEKSGKALLRASQKAREVAKKTGTPIVIFKDGQMKKEDVL